MTKKFFKCNYRHQIASPGSSENIKQEKYHNTKLRCGDEDYLSTWIGSVLRYLNASLDAAVKLLIFEIESKSK